MRGKLYLYVIILSMISCNAISSNMTVIERKLINDGDSNTSFRVLLTTNKEDSLFLRKQCIDVDAKNIAKDKDLQLFIKRLKVTLEVEEGVGIAAPQVGIGRNIFLFLRVTEPDMPVQVVINPRIVAYPEETICFEGDGCLSIPGASGNSIRYPWVEVEYYNEKGEQIREKLSGYSRKTGFTGVIFQHEYDHLQGTLFIDKLCDIPAQVIRVEKKEVENINVKNWTNALSGYVRKYGNNNSLQFDICNVSIITSSENKEAIVLTGIAKQLFHKYQQIELTWQDDKLYAQLSITEDVADHDVTYDIYNLMFALDSEMEKMTHVDVTDIAKEYNIAKLWLFLYDQGHGKKGLSSRNNIYAKSFDGVDTKLGITTMSTLPLDMYPISFLQSIIFETQDGTFITIKVADIEQSAKWSIVLPFAEKEKATASVSELIKLMKLINPQIEKLNK